MRKKGLLFSTLLASVSTITVAYFLEPVRLVKDAEAMPISAFEQNQSLQCSPSSEGVESGQKLSPSGNVIYVPSMDHERFRLSQIQAATNRAQDPEKENQKQENRIKQRGKASWYGGKFQGKTTASGEPYDMHKLTAAHKTLPLNSKVQVKNLNNGRTVIVEINDRGPFTRGRILDLSLGAWKQLDGGKKGEIQVAILHP